MAQSLNKIFLHIIFHIKTTSPRILDADVERLHEYVGELINTTDCQAVRVGGVETFEEEYIKFLKLHNIEYDERYVFAD